MVAPSSISMEPDRTDLVPRHRGPNVLPNFPLFTKLLGFAHRSQKVAINDLKAGLVATHVQLLTDVLCLRNAIENSLAPQVLARLKDGEEVYINMISPGGYEYAVAFLAIVAVGAVVVPLATTLPPQEASYFATKSQAVAVLTASASTPLGRILEERIRKSVDPCFACIEILPNICKPPLQPGDIFISSDRYLDSNAAGLVIFTSGTTGPPKGAVMRRASLYDEPITVADHYHLGADDVVLHMLPVHHATGISITFLPFLLSAACIEFRTGSFDPAWTWNRWQQGGLTFFSGVPTMYTRLMWHFETHLNGLPSVELKPYLEGVKRFRGLICGTSALPRPLHQKWTRLMDGKSILTRYGATEFGAVFKVPLNPVDVPDGSVGEVISGVDVRLADGDEGEVLVKSPFLFSKYLFDQDATAKAHNAEGYFKTGDIARRDGPHYFILGRASVDIIKSGGYKISALDIEREILGLEYVSEVMVVGVDDEEYGQRSAAAVVLHDKALGLTLGTLRHELRGRLAAYKMPTLLRVVDELPKTVTGKVLKKILGPRLFPVEGHKDVQMWKRKQRVEIVSRL